MGEKERFMIYPFKCESCGNYFELDMTVAEYKEFSPAPCKKCGEEVGRVITVPMVSIKRREVEDGHQKTLRKLREGAEITRL